METEEHSHPRLFAYPRPIPTMTMPRRDALGVG